MFSNEQISLDALPETARLDLKRLPDQYKYTQIIARVLTTLLVVPAIVLIRARADDGLFDILTRTWPLIALILAIYVLWPILAHRFRGYALRQSDLVYVSGIVWRKTTAIAFNRIQHIENKQGPLERFFELSTLELYTAGGSSGDLSIPGLFRTDASAIRQYILRRTQGSEMPETK